VHLDAEACLDCVEALRGRHLGFCSLELGREGNDLAGNLVAGLGPAPAWQQADKPAVCNAFWAL
jgi:hypothetical protein